MPAAVEAWFPYIKGRVEVFDVEATHDDMLLPPSAMIIGQKINAALASL